MAKGCSAVPHPFKVWLDKAGLSYKQAVALLTLGGRNPSPNSAKYLEQIVTGFRHPSYSFAKELSQITNGAVSVEQFMEFGKGEAA